MYSFLLTCRIPDEHSLVLSLSRAYPHSYFLPPPLSPPWLVSPVFRHRSEAIFSYLFLFVRFSLAYRASVAVRGRD